MIFNWTDGHPPIEKSRDDRWIDIYTIYVIRVIHIRDFSTRYFRDQNVIFTERSYVRFERVV